MNTELNIIPEYAVFCDFIRREDSGKLIFVGVYTQGLAVEALPSEVVFSTYVHGRFSGTGGAKFECRIIRKSDEKVIFSAKASVSPEFSQMPGLKFEMVIPAVSHEIIERDQVLAQINCENRGWKEFGNLQIDSAENIRSIASRRPSEQSQPAAQG